MNKSDRSEVQKRLLKLFNGKPERQVFDTGKYVFVKVFNSQTNSWQVNIYTSESYKNSQDFMKHGSVA